MNIFSPLSTLRFSIHYYTMILQRIRVIVRDAGDSNPIAIFVQPHCQWFNLCGVSRMLVCFLHILSVRRSSTYRFLFKILMNRLKTSFFRFKKMFACKARNLRVYLTTLTENFSLFLTISFQMLKLIILDIVSTPKYILHFAAIYQLCTRSKWLRRHQACLFNTCPTSHDYAHTRLS